MPQALQREHLALQNMKFIHFFHFLEPFLLEPDPDPDPDCESGSGSGSGDPIESDPMRIRIQIRNTAYNQWNLMDDNKFIQNRTTVKIAVKF